MPAKRDSPGSKCKFKNQRNPDPDSERERESIVVLKFILQYSLIHVNVRHIFKKYSSAIKEITRL